MSFYQMHFKIHYYGHYLEVNRGHKFLEIIHILKFEIFPQISEKKEKIVDRVIEIQQTVTKDTCFICMTFGDFSMYYTSAEVTSTNQS